MGKRRNALFYILALSVMGLNACTSPLLAPVQPLQTGVQSASNEAAATAVPAITPYATRPTYNPGELVDYTAQSGDTLVGLASHFNTSVEEIRKANPIIPDGATTMPPGMPMKIPIYYMSFWGNPYKIIPDSEFVNGPAQDGFDVEAFVNSQPGWLKNVYVYAAERNRSGAEVVEFITLNYSVSPRLLLALLEYQSGALSQPTVPEGKADYPLGYTNPYYHGVYMQLFWAANLLNNGYYLWREGRLNSFDLSNGRIDRPDPWQNAATVALHNYFSQIMPVDAYEYAVSEEGFSTVYQSLFGDPWKNEQVTIPGSLYQPAFLLPFLPGKTWAYTGGPHTGWGSLEPLAAIDFAPPAAESGCNQTDEWATAVADGVIARSEGAIVVLDIDGDGNERTGWTVFYLHIEGRGRIAQGTTVKAGQPVGHPSCEGGDATGTHIHIARKYNGEWIPADGTLAFNLEGWVAHAGSSAYRGTLTRFEQTITACDCSDQYSHIQAGGQP